MSRDPANQSGAADAIGAFQAELRKLIDQYEHLTSLEADQQQVDEQTRLKINRLQARINVLIREALKAQLRPAAAASGDMHDTWRDEFSPIHPSQP
jgi:hypothetical protein